MKDLRIISIFLCQLFLLFDAFVGRAEIVELQIDPAKLIGKIDLTRFALGQGGLSDKPMFDSQVEQIAQLHPQTIRVFVQEFFALNPSPGKYHWETLDKVIETIRATGAKPILSLCFKPKVLFPKIDQTIVHPNDYGQWEALIIALVKHCNSEKHYGIEYWEIGNEPDIGEDGGCPYRFDPDDYVRYYQHTANAILKADAHAKIGGPALAGYNSAIGDALIQHCGTTNTPLDFFSWHIYHSDPNYFRKSVRDLKAKLSRFPRLKNTETIIDEWNMSLDSPVLNPSFQPAFVLEVTRAFHEEGLSRGAYYHIRDSYVDAQQFATFMSKSGAAFVAEWWNDTPQYDGLYDNQGRVRPAYFSFKLLSLIKGEELTVLGTTRSIHALAAVDGKRINILLWNYSGQGQAAPQQVDVKFSSIIKRQGKVFRLNSTANLDQLEMQAAGGDNAQGNPIHVTLEPFGIRWISLEL